jgi:hypothetical protein
MVEGRLPVRSRSAGQGDQCSTCATLVPWQRSACGNCDRTPQIVPIRAEQWTTWERVRAVFDSPTDPGWDSERRDFGAAGLDDPWAR